MAKTPVKSLVKAKSSVKAKSLVKAKSSVKAKSLVKAKSSVKVKSPVKTKPKSPKVIVQNQHSKTLKEFINNNKYKFLTAGLATAGAAAFAINFRKKTAKEVKNTANDVISNVKEAIRTPETKDNLSDVASQAIIKVADHYVEMATKTVYDILVTKPYANVKDILNRIGNVTGLTQEEKSEIDKKIEEEIKQQEKIEEQNIKEFYTRYNKEQLKDYEEYLQTNNMVSNSCLENYKTTGDYPCYIQEQKKAINLITELMKNPKEFLDFCKNKKEEIKKLLDAKELQELKNFEEYLFNNYNGIDCYSYFEPAGSSIGLNVLASTCNKEQKTIITPKVDSCFKKTKGDKTKINSECGFSPKEKSWYSFI